MMLLIYDVNPQISAQRVPDGLKFKQLLELAQLISSITNSVYKPIKQGKEIQEWIKNNSEYTKIYYTTLFQWCKENIKMKDKTISDLQTIYNSIGDTVYITPKNAIFRYSKDYTESKYLSKTLLPINEAIIEYNKYTNWKIDNMITKWVDKNINKVKDGK